MCFIFWCMLSVDLPDVLPVFSVVFCIWQLNSRPPPLNSYMRQWIGPSLVQVMACDIFGAEPLPEPMLPYWSVDSVGTNFSKVEFESYHFHSRKCISNAICQNGGHFVRGGGGGGGRGGELNSFFLYYNSLCYTVLQLIECTTSTSMSAMILLGEQLIRCVISMTISPQMARCLLCSVTNRLLGGTCRYRWRSHQRMNWLCVKCMCMVTVSIGNSDREI